MIKNVKPYVGLSKIKYFFDFEFDNKLIRGFYLWYEDELELKPEIRHSLFFDTNDKTWKSKEVTDYQLEKVQKEAELFFNYAYSLYEYNFPIKDNSGHLNCNDTNHILFHYDALKHTLNGGPILPAIQESHLNFNLAFLHVMKLDYHFGIFLFHDLFNYNPEGAVIDGKCPNDKFLELCAFAYSNMRQTEKIIENTLIKNMESKLVIKNPLSGIEPKYRTELKLNKKDIENSALTLLEWAYNFFAKAGSGNNTGDINYDEGRIIKLDDSIGIIESKYDYKQCHFDYGAIQRMEHLENLNIGTKVKFLRYQPNRILYHRYNFTSIYEILIAEHILPI